MPWSCQRIRRRLSRSFSQTVARKCPRACNSLQQYQGEWRGILSRTAQGRRQELPLTQAARPRFWREAFLTPKRMIVDSSTRFTTVRRLAFSLAKTSAHASNSATNRYSRLYAWSGDVVPRITQAAVCWATEQHQSVSGRRDRKAVCAFISFSNSGGTTVNTTQTLTQLSRSPHSVIARSGPRTSHPRRETGMCSITLVPCPNWLKISALPPCSSAIL